MIVAIKRLTEEGKKKEMQRLRERDNKYHREWQKKNPDKVKAAQERFYSKLAEEYKKQEEDAHECND